MAELRTIRSPVEGSSIVDLRNVKVTGSVIPHSSGSAPCWRGLLSPSEGQRALDLGHGKSDLFASLSRAGVSLEPESRAWTEVEPECYDFVLEERKNGTPISKAAWVRHCLAPGGSWVVVLENRWWLGFSGQSMLRSVRQGGFQDIESFYAHPSLGEPQMLVPLNHPEPFRFFLEMAVRRPTLRHRVLRLMMRVLLKLRCHRAWLPNLIVVARKKP